MTGLIPRMRTCANCGEDRRCRFTGQRWVCDPCWNALFPRGEDIAA